MHIVLIGDSIFDNASYVSKGDSVSDLLRKAVPEAQVTLLAVDGDVTTDVKNQLRRFPKDATNVFVSCGGNDALGSINILEREVTSVGEALQLLYHAREKFRSNYIEMIKNITRVSNCVSACTIYNRIPGLSQSALVGLTIYNEVILEELAIRKIPVIDLRVICNDASDYSDLSPIEPSKEGGNKIVKALLASL